MTDNPFGHLERKRQQEAEQARRQAEAEEQKRIEEKRRELARIERQ